MSQAKHTPGPWFFVNRKVKEWDADSDECLSIQTSAAGFESDRSVCGIHALDDRSIPDARLIAAAPELLEVLHECIDAQWVIDSHAVEFDGTVHFGPYYDFSGLDGIDRHEFLAEHSCVVWPSGGKWSAYCTYEGSTWFESFDGADAAKETCMKLLDKVMPTHPAMKARAAIAKATGGE
mgnify:CR=1 FL=1